MGWLVQVTDHGRDILGLVRSLHFAPIILHRCRKWIAAQHMLLVWVIQQHGDRPSTLPHNYLGSQQQAMKGDVDHFEGLGRYMTL